MALTVLKIKNLKPDLKDRKYSDGEGLFLMVKPNGVSNSIEYFPLISVQLFPLYCAVKRDFYDA